MCLGEPIEGEIEQTPWQDERRPTPDRLRPGASDTADSGPVHDREQTLLMIHDRLQGARDAEAHEGDAGSARTPRSMDSSQGKSDLAAPPSTNRVTADCLGRINLVQKYSGRSETSRSQSTKICEPKAAEQTSKQRNPDQSETNLVF
jgi:hypothetical protein